MQKTILTHKKNQEAMTIAEFIEAIDNGRAKVLTLEKAKGLKGRRIYWMYFGYKGNSCGSKVQI